MIRFPSKLSHGTILSHISSYNPSISLSSNIGSSSILSSINYINKKQLSTVRTNTSQNFSSSVSHSNHNSSSLLSTSTSLISSFQPVYYSNTISSSIERRTYSTSRSLCISSSSSVKMNTTVPLSFFSTSTVSSSTTSSSSSSLLPNIQNPSLIPSFTLSPDFVQSYSTIPPPFGFNGLGEFVYQTRYARVVPGTNKKETWYQTVERVINGTYTMQKRWIIAHELGWDELKAQQSAQEMYKKIFYMKFLPPGRGLWAMGSPMTEERMLYASLNNCAFVSTKDIHKGDPTQPFTFLMDAAMLGVGVGFDTDGAGKIIIQGCTPSSSTTNTSIHVIEDSREGWVNSVRDLLDAYINGNRPRPVFDYSLIRPRGTPIKGFGGTASGPAVLQRLHEDIDQTLAPLSGKPLTITAIVDIMNQIGRCIVSGDVRQTAEIAFGDPLSLEYIDLKNYTKNPKRGQWGWTSNNSVYAELGMNYDPIAERILHGGEPGFAWLKNMQQYSRMNGIVDNKDKKAKGGNPCLEQTLESYELCCLVETFPNNHESFEEFASTLKYAYLYAKTVTLGRTHWPATNRVMLRNRRIGCSISGIAQFIADKGIHELHDWCENGYQVIQEADKKFSDWLAIPKSIKTTCVKPSGTVSLLAGATPGMHYPESRFYYRRVRLGITHEAIKPLIEAGYHIEPAVEDPERKVVVTFPVDAAATPTNNQNISSSSNSKKHKLRTLDELTMWEQFSLAAFLQRHWADNQVSCTITFDPEKEGKQIPRALDVYQYQLKGVSLLPRAPKLAYKQLPYESITEQEYNEAIRKLKRVDFSSLHGDNHSAPDKFCDSTRCDVEIIPTINKKSSTNHETNNKESIKINPVVPSEEAEDLDSGPMKKLN